MSANIRLGRDTDFKDLAQIDFPYIASASLAQMRFLSRSFQPTVLPSAFGDLRVWPRGFLTPQPETPYAQIEFSVAARTGTLYMKSDIIDYSISGLLSENPDLQIREIPKELSVLILEELNHTLLSYLEEKLRAPIRFRSIDMDANPPETWDIALEVSLAGSDPQGVFIECHQLEKQAFERWVHAIPVQKNDFSAVRVPVSLRAGYTELTIEDFMALEPGQGIILDESYLSYQKIVAVVDEAFVQTCTWQTARPVLDGPILTYAKLETLGFTKGGSVADQTPDHSTGSIQDISLNLIFELGRTEMTLSELETIGEGYAFDLGKPLSQAVDIIAGGKQIGVGELVRIGDSIGVRIVRVAK